MLAPLMSPHPMVVKYEVINIKNTTHLVLGTFCQCGVRVVTKLTVTFVVYLFDMIQGN